MTNLDLFLSVPEYEVERDPLDRYYTPEWVTEVLVEHLGDRLSGPLLEPCAGECHIVRVLERHGHDVTAQDVSASYAGRPVHRVDFIRYTPYPGQRWAWIITNPPYKTAEGYTAADFVRRALELAERGVAMLVWQSFLEGCEDRRDLFQARAPSDVLFLPRFNFIRPGHRHASSPDRCAVWLVWERGRSGTTLRWFGPEVRP